jgi:tripartite-type tricarboxylate transporter receptor subunit TctC
MARLRRRLDGLFVAIALTNVASPALTQTFPSKPIRVVVPFPSGGDFDVMMRVVAAQASKGLAQTLVVDPRPGGSSVVGTELVARAGPDGYSVLVVGTSFTILPAIRSKLSYDIHKDFAAVTQLTTVPVVIAVHPSLPVRNLKELIALAREKPGALTYGTPGTGVAQHVAFEMLKLAAKVDITHVPYQGSPAALTSVLGGHTSIGAVNLPSAISYINAGKLRGLAVGSSTRSPIAPAIPTLIESGFPGAEATAWVGLVVRSGTSGDAIARLNTEMIRALDAADVRESLKVLGWSTVGSTSEQFAAFIRSEAEKYAKVAKEAHIRAD